MMIISSLEISLLLQISNCQQLQYALLLIIQRHVRGVKERAVPASKATINSRMEVNHQVRCKVVAEER